MSKDIPPFPFQTGNYEEYASSLKAYIQHLQGVFKRVDITEAELREKTKSLDKAYQLIKELKQVPEDLKPFFEESDSLSYKDLSETLKLLQGGTAKVFQDVCSILDHFPDKSIHVQEMMAARKVVNHQYKVLGELPRLEQTLLAVIRLQGHDKDTLGRVAELESENGRLKKELESSARHSFRGMSDTQAEVNELRRQLAHKKDNIADLQIMMTDLEQENAELRELVNDQNQNSWQDMEGHMVLLKEQLVNQQRHLKETEDRNAATLAELQDELIEVKQLNAELLESAEEAKQLKKDNARLEAMISKLSAALDKIESGGNEKGLLAALEKQLAQSQARNQEMERRFMEGLERQGKRLKDETEFVTQITELKIQLQNAEEKKEEAISIASELGDANSTIEGMLHTAEQRIISLQVSLQDSEKEIGKLESRLEAKENSMGPDLSAFENILGDMKRFGEIEGKAAGLQKENEILEQRLHRTNEQIAELEQMLAKSKAVEQEMSTDISKIPGLLTENERLEERIAKLNEALEKSESGSAEKGDSKMFLELQSQLEALTEGNTQLHENLANLVSSNGDLTKQKESLERKLEDLHSEHERTVLDLQDAKNHLEESKNVRQMLEADKEGLNKSLEAERKKKEMYEGKYNELTHIHAKMQAGDSEEQQNGVRVLQSRLEEMMASNMALSANMMELQKSFVENSKEKTKRRSIMRQASMAQLAESEHINKKEISELKSLVAEMTESRDELAEELQRNKEAYEFKLKELTNANADGDSELSKRLEQLITNNTNLTFQIGELTKRNMEVVSLEAKASANARSAQEELLKSRTRLADVKDRNKNLEEQIDQLREQLTSAVSSAQEEIVKSRTSLGDMKDTNRNLQEEIQEMRKQLREAINSGKKASELAQASDTECERLKTMINSMKRESSSSNLRTEVMDLRVELTRLRDEHDEAQALIADYESRNKVGSESVERKLKEMRESWDASERRANVAEEALSEAQNALNVATQSLTVTQKEVKALERENGAVEKEVSLLRMENDRLTRKNERQKELFEREKSELEKKILLDESPETIQKMSNAILKLKADYVQMQTKLSETNNKNKEVLEKSDSERMILEQALANAEKKVEEYRQGIRKSEEKRINIELEKEELEGQLKTMLQENTRATEANDDLKIKIEDLERRVTHLRLNQGDPELEGMYDKLTKDFTVQRNELALAREKHRSLQSDLGALRRDYNKLSEEHETLQHSSIDVEIVTRLEEEVKSLTKQTNLLMEDQLALSSKSTQTGQVEELRMKLRAVQKEKMDVEEELVITQRRLNSEQFVKESESTSNLLEDVRRLREQKGELEVQLEQMRLEKVEIDSEDRGELAKARLRIGTLERQLEDVSQPASNMKLVQKDGEITALKTTIDTLRKSLRNAADSNVEEWVMKYNDLMIEKRQLEQEINDEIVSGERRAQIKEQGTSDLVHMLQDKLTAAMEQRDKSMENEDQVSKRVLELEKIVEEGEIKIEDLLKSNENLTKKVVKLKKAGKQLQKEIDEPKRDEIDNLLTKVSALTQTCEKQRAVIDRYSKSEDDMKEKIRILKKGENALNEEIDELKGKVASSPRANEKATKLLEKQKRYISQLENKVESMESRVFQSSGFEKKVLDELEKTIPPSGLDLWSELKWILAEYSTRIENSREVGKIKDAESKRNSQLKFELDRVKQRCEHLEKKFISGDLNVIANLRNENSTLRARNLELQLQRDDRGYNDEEFSPFHDTYNDTRMAFHEESEPPLDDLDKVIRKQVASYTKSPSPIPRSRGSSKAPKAKPKPKEARNPQTLDEWFVGDEIEVYSRGLKQWLRGEVLSKSAHYVRVKYGDRCKDLKADSDKLRLYRS